MLTPSNSLTVSGTRANTAKGIIRLCRNGHLAIVGCVKIDCPKAPTSAPVNE